MIIFRDITDHMRALDHLRDQARILDVINDAIIVVDTFYRISSWNSRAEYLYGWKEEEVLGKPAADVIRSDIIGMDRSEVYRKLEHGEAVMMESFQRTKDNRTLRVQGYTVPLPDADGINTGYVAVNRDITKSKEAETALQMTLERLNTLVSNMRIGILLVGEGEIRLANQTFCDYFDLIESPSDLEGLPSSQLINKIKDRYLHPGEEAIHIQEIVRHRQPGTR